MFGNFSSFTTPSWGWVSIPNSCAYLFIFYILSYILSKTMHYLSGHLVSSVNVQKLFCGICSVFKRSFDESLREKVVSLSYSSANFQCFHFFTPFWYKNYIYIKGSIQQEDNTITNIYGHNNKPPNIWSKNWRKRRKKQSYNSLRFQYHIVHNR